MDNSRISIEFQGALTGIRHRSVSLGYMTVHLHEVEELSKAQIGYSVDQSGTSLVSNEEGGWSATWLVIGYEDMCGDPIFVDTQSMGFSVYTAMHGEGTWDPTLIARSLDVFDQILSLFSVLAKGREHPVALEANPIPTDERTRLLVQIKTINPGVETDFWENWLS